MWVYVALLAALASGFALYALFFRQKVTDGQEDLAVYRRQLTEIETDRARGLLESTAAGAAKLEVERRILKAGAAKAVAERKPLPLAVVVGVIAAVLLGAIFLYVKGGSPLLPDAPAIAAADQVIDTGSGKIDMNQALDRLLTYLNDHPDDMQGWGHVRRLAPLVRRDGDYAMGLMKAVAARPDDGALRALYAESLIAMGEGRIGPAAQLALLEAAAVDPKNPGLRYYQGMALAQDGHQAEAAEIWRVLLAESPADAPWRPQVEARLRQVDAGSGDRATAAAEMAALPPEQRMARIRGMVEGLASRLQPVAEDREGWARLTRAYRVLGETEKAAAAYKTALKLAQGAGDQELVDALQQENAQGR